MSQPLILVDGSSYFFRAFHALPPLTNSKGQPTGAIYGVANMVKRLIKDYQSQKIAVVFDAKGKTFRDELYPEYKANRPPMPSELSSQFQPLQHVLSAMGLPLIVVDGVEADDVIGTLAKKATAKGLEVVISTGDKDMAQLVDAQVTLINTMTNQILDGERVQGKFGVTPAQIIDYLTLIGDQSDNVPGVPKCGPKTAVKWLHEYHTLENIIDHADDIGGKIGENLRETLPKLPLSKQLITIKTDVSLPVGVDDLILEPQNKQKLAALAREFEFKSWLKELLVDEAQNATTSASYPIQFELINEEASFSQWLDALTASAAFCIDTETTSLDATQAELVGIALALDGDTCAYIPLAHDEDIPQLPIDSVLTRLKPILENPAIKKIGQNLKYDYSVLKNVGITLAGIAFDTMLESYVLNSTAVRHDMDSLALKYLGYQPISFTDIAGKGAKQLRFNQIPVEKAAPYAAEDAAITLKLHQTLYPMMDDTLRSVFDDIEMPLVSVIADMEAHGVLIDEVVLAKQGERLKAKIASLEAEALTLAGKTFNLNSPKQLQEILFNELKLPVHAKTPKGQPSTAESVLQELAFDYRLPAIILEYRSLSKLVSTYIDALPRRMNPSSKRVHTSYNQAIAATGRLSSSEPNLQNIPIRSEEGRMIRQAFIVPREHCIIAADYSQIELRIMAHLSQDKGLVNAFAHDLDIHAATASEIFGVALDAVSQEQRRRAKAVNFGLIYGMSAFGLAKQLGVERQDAQTYINRYFERYPGVLDYMEQTRDKAHQQGYVETVFGRRLHLPEINARNLMRQKAAERTAINAPMQGTAADIIKKSMLALAQWQKGLSHGRATMVMQVHDELVFEVHDDFIETAKQEIKHIMENTVKLSVPLKVSIGTGPNWDEAH